MRPVNKPMPLTKEIQALPPGRLYLGGGLLLKTTPTGYRCWMFRYKSPITGRFTETSIGPWPECGPSYARQVATQLRVMVLKGDDPVQVARQREASRTTFAEASEGWINKHKSKWRSLKDVKILLGHARPLAHMPVRTIDQRMIVDALADLNKRHPEQARRALRVWAQVFDYAKVMGYRTGDNPAAWRGNMEHIFPNPPKNHNKHHASMPSKDVPEFVQRLRLRQVKGQSAAALEFQILTASRPSEVLGMKWSELDLINRIWTLPPERTKQGREHRVPFSERCMEILALQNEYRPGEFVFRTGDFVFTGYKGEALDDKSLRELLKRMDLPVHVTPSGFRKSFRNWTARARINNERIDRYLAEMCLGHSIKGKVEAAYWTEDALDERRPIMDAWAAYCG
jgi:integrase